MQKTRNADTVKGVSASEKSDEHQDYTINPDKRKEEIHRNPIRLQRSLDQLPIALKQLNQWQKGTLLFISNIL